MYVPFGGTCRNQSAHSFRTKIRGTLHRAESLPVGARLLGDGDPVQELLAACGEVYPLAWCLHRDLWQTYAHGTAACQGRIPPSRRAFAALLTARGGRVDRTSTARIWRGIRLMDKSP